MSAKRPTPQTLTTHGGVTVIVNPAPPPEPERRAEVRAPEAPAPRVVVRPPERRAEEGARDAFVRRLDAEHGKLIKALCHAQGDVGYESTKDMAQRVLVTAGEQFDKHDFATHGPPENVEGWLATLVTNDARNHRRLWKPEVDREAEPDAAFCPAPDPAGTAELAEQRTKLFRYLAALPADEREVVVCADLYELTIKETAAAVGRPWGTVASQLARARVKLEGLAQESDRATEAGERRR